MNKNNFFKIEEKKSKKILNLSYILIIINILLFLLLFNSKKILNNILYIKLENFIINNEVLDLSNKHLGDKKSMSNIVEYIKTNKNITGLNIGNNKYKYLLSGFLYKKLDFINYGNIDNYNFSKYYSGIQIKKHGEVNFKIAKKQYDGSLKIANKILFTNFNYDNIDYYKIVDFSDGKKLFYFYYYLISNSKKNIYIDFNNKILSSKQTIALKKIEKEFKNGNINLEDINKLKNKIKSINSISNIKDIKDIKDNFKLFFNKGKFKNKITVYIKNFFYEKRSNYKSLELLEEINNKKINFKFFNCNKNFVFPNCYTLQNKTDKFINDILNNSKIKISLDNYFSSVNQNLFLNIYFALKKRKTNLRILDLSNNYVNQILFEKLILKFKNLKTLILSNLKNSNDKFVIDLTTTEIKAFDIGNTNILFLVNLIKVNNFDEKYILMNKKKNKYCSKPSSIKEYSLPELFRDKKAYLSKKGGDFCRWGKKNVLGKYSGHFYFSENFFEFRKLNKKNKSKIYKIFNYLNKMPFLSKNTLTETDIETILYEIRSTEYENLGKKYFIDELKKILKNTNNYSDIFLQKEKIEKYIYLIKAFVYYDNYLQKYYNYFGDNIKNKIPFKEIYKEDKVTIFIKNFG